jgi:hypothetical protein
MNMKNYPKKARELASKYDSNIILPKIEECLQKFMNLYNYFLL